MTSRSEQGAKRFPGYASAEFFLPDLCASRPVVIMILLTELMVVVYVLGVSSLPAFDWGNLALSSLFVQWIVLLSAAFLCVLRKWLTRLSILLAVTCSLLVILLVTLFSSAVAGYLLGDSDFGALGGWWALRNLLMAAVIGGVVLRYFYLQQQLRLHEQAELHARVESLRAKIRPHFLFNTMNSIASLIGSRPEAAEQAVEDLSELFRASLVENNERATLGDELRLCDLYLRIEQLRLGDRMRLRWEIDDAARGYPLPALLIQPLVENAVYHGLALIPEGGEIAITARLEDDQMRIRITNPLPGVAEESHVGHQMALDNIRQRLDAHYGDGASLRLHRDEQSHEVELNLPLAFEGLTA